MQYFFLDAVLLHSAMDSSKPAEYWTLPRNHGLNGSYMKTEILTFLIFYPVPCTHFARSFPTFIGWDLLTQTTFSSACDMASNSDVRLIGRVQVFIAPPLQPGRIGIYDMHVGHDKHSLFKPKLSVLQMAICSSTADSKPVFQQKRRHLLTVHQ